LRISNGRQKGNLGATGIQPRVLYDDRNVGLEDRGIVGIARNRLRIIQIVEAQMQRVLASDGDAIRADRLPVGEKNSNGHMRVTLAGVENAGGLVRDQVAIGI
jgi:hypothetical protein